MTFNFGEARNIACVIEHFSSKSAEEAFAIMLYRRVGI
jgi:hypothetical protein